MLFSLLQVGGMFGGQATSALGFGQQQSVGGMNLGGFGQQQQSGTGNPPFDPAKVCQLK